MLSALNPDGKTPASKQPAIAAGVLRIVFFYAAFSGIYILVSDNLVHWLFSDPQKITLVSIIKGWLFIGVTAFLLYVLIYRLLSQLLAAVAERDQAEKTIHNLAFYDRLTGLPNRTFLLNRLKNSFTNGGAFDQQAALLSIDLDDFKTLNDTQGHEVGDLLLTEVAQKIEQTVCEHGIAVRMGSDEFVVLLERLGNDQDGAAAFVKEMAEKIHQVIKAPLSLNGYDYHCKACIGISLFSSHQKSVDEILIHADAAMFQAKQSGRDQIHFFDANKQAALENRVRLESALRKAIPEQLRLYYQIQVNDEGKALGAEALIRWHHPEQGLISPAEFIPLAETSGLILPMGKWVIETACKQLKSWENNPLTHDLKIAINVSAKQFHQADFVDTVLTACALTGANPNKLKIELTESLLLENIDAVVEKMSTLKAQGIRFSLDDFGTGFSSLSYLKRLPLHQLKIDQSFVRDIMTDPNDAAIARTVIALGHSLGLSVIAEGVETQDQRQFLAVNGCTHFQGYLFGRPLPVAEFEALLVQGHL